MHGKPQVTHWLEFGPSDLDNAPLLDRVFCVGWRDTGHQFERWTEVCNGAKRGDRLFVGKAVRATAGAAAQYNFQASDIVAIPLIGHDQTQSSRSDLPFQLATAIAHSISARVEHSLLSKSKHPPIHKIKNPLARDKTVRGAYSFQLPPGGFASLPLIIVVDDLVTRGSSMNDAARAIRNSLPDATIIGIAMGKTARSTSLTPNGKLEERDISNEHLPANIRRIIGMPQLQDQDPPTESTPTTPPICNSSNTPERPSVLTWPGGTKLRTVYEEAKLRYPNHLIFIQCGYFFELRGQDAEVMHIRAGWDVVDRDGEPWTGTPTNTVQQFDDLRGDNIPFLIISEGLQEPNGKQRFISEVHSPPH